MTYEISSNGHHTSLKRTTTRPGVTHVTKGHGRSLARVEDDVELVRLLSLAGAQVERVRLEVDGGGRSNVICNGAAASDGCGKCNVIGNGRWTRQT